jgi:hypothetical protein
MKNILKILKTIALLAIVFSCSNNSETTQEEELNELNRLQLEIEQLIELKDCLEASNCNYIAFGSKPCGGPKSYLIYNSSVDIELLELKVISYNNLDKAYNLKWGILSDCYFVTPPPSIECINGTCTAIYN